MKLRQERIENSDVHYDSNSSRQHSTIYTKDEEAEFFPRKYSRLRTLKWKMLHFNTVISYYKSIIYFFRSTMFDNHPKKSHLTFFLIFAPEEYFMIFTSIFQMFEISRKHWLKYLMNLSFEFSRQIRVFPFFISKII